MRTVTGNLTRLMSKIGSQTYVYAAAPALNSVYDAQEGKQEYSLRKAGWGKKWMQIVSFKNPIGYKTKYSVWQHINKNNIKPC